MGQQTLFEFKHSDHTGVTFNNELADTPEDNIMIYSNFYGGAGVGLGDLNNDGLVDLYFAGNQVGDQMYQNLGNFTFKDVTSKAGIKDDGSWSSGVVMADVNRDGLLDIYVTKELYDNAPELRKNKLYINQGNFKFKDMAAEYGVDDDARTRHATFLDFDRDGDLDLFLCNQPPNTGDYSQFYGTDLSLEEYSLRLYQNQGNRFVDITESSGLLRTGFPNSVTASDLNNDGWTDLFIANDFWIGDWLFINQGDGTFEEKSHENLNHISFSSMGVDAADLNNDALLDVMVVDMVAEDNYRLKANMSGMNPSAFWKVVDDGGHYQYMFNMLHYNSGDAQFHDIAQMAGVASTDWSWSNLIADLDNDGWKDIYVTNGLLRDIRNTDASKNVAHLIESTVHEYIQKNPNPEGISIWDIVDIDDVLDLVPSQKLSNYVFKNNGDLTFSKCMEDWGLTQETFSNGSAYADLDNDGDLDLVINNINDKAGIYENHTNSLKENNYLRIRLLADSDDVQSLGTKIWIHSGGEMQYLETTNVRGMYSTSEQIAHFGTGTKTVIDTVRILWPNDHEQILLNVQANQVLDVASSKAKPIKTSSPVISTLLTEVDFEGLDYKHEENDYDDYQNQVLLPHKMSTLGPCIASADLNGDGLEDLVAGGAIGQETALYFQTEEGTFALQECEAFNETKASEDMGIGVLDYDNDGDLDLYIVSGGNEYRPGSKRYLDRIYENDGKGQFTRNIEALPEITSSGSKVYPHDFDQDGWVDLLVCAHHIPWAYPEPASSTLLKNNGGRFEDMTATLAPQLEKIGMVNDADWFDYDGDGDLDMLLAGEWMSLTILENDNGAFQKVESPSLEAHTGWWFSVETADMDGDGDLDIVAGNLGLNYKYQASMDEPFEVYYEDWDQNGKNDIILTYYNFGEKFPLRGRSCSSEQIPKLKEEFATYDLFASSNLFEIYGEEELSDALHYAATDYATSYIENLGNGEFAFHQLPNLAQISSVNDIEIRDLNDDQNPDIILAGNLFHAEIETARNDAGFGLVLTGDGKGTFEVMNRRESGLFVPTDVKSFSVLKVNGQDVLMVASNDEKLKAYRISK